MHSSLEPAPLLLAFLISSAPALLFLITAFVGVLSLRAENSSNTWGSQLLQTLACRESVLLLSSPLLCSCFRSCHYQIDVPPAKSQFQASFSLSITSCLSSSVSPLWYCLDSMGTIRVLTLSRVLSRVIPSRPQFSSHSAGF